MRRAAALALFLIVALLIALSVGAQEQPDPRTLLPPQMLKAIAQEVSGAQAYNHVIDMCGCERDWLAGWKRAIGPTGGIRCSTSATRSQLSLG